MTRPSDEEEKYFKALEIEQRRKLRDRISKSAAQLEEQRAIAASSGTDDLSVADRIAALGFDGDSARAFDLMPLIYVAWADGAIQKGERAAILGLLEARGIEPGSSAFTTIESLLEERPTDAFMSESLAVLQDMLGGESRGKSLVDLCIEIATSAGGFLGLGGKVSDEERAALDEVAAALGTPGADKLRAELGQDE